MVHELLLAAATHYFSPSQFGFVQKRWTTTNLVEYLSLCPRTIDAGLAVDTVFSDIKAAFDSVPHVLLLAKLKILGLPEML